VLDETGRVAGRGAYLCRDGACWAAALQRGAIGRALDIELPQALREVLAAGPSPTLTIDEGGARGQE
jgi:predicted RNA-binding protein YlxR (DUF448 family)